MLRYIRKGTFGEEGTFGGEGDKYL